MAYTCKHEGREYCGECAGSGTVVVPAPDEARTETRLPEDLHRDAARPRFDLVAHLYRQCAFSSVTFGPGERTSGVLDHIRKELVEIENDPADLREWIDVVLLAFDGAWRSGHSPEAIAAALEQKQRTNEQRKWPDWRTADPEKAIEHIRPDPAGPAPERSEP